MEPYLPTKRFFFGYQTVTQGDRALVINHRGEAKTVDGPARVTLFRSSIKKLHKFIAGQGEYLEVQKKDGEKSIMPGPCSLFHNPTLYERIELRQAMFVNAGEAIVIYRSVGGQKQNHNTQTEGWKDNKDNQSIKIERILKYGPTRYFPEPDEWLHNFKWHGTDPVNKTRKIYGALEFTKLRVIADQVYYNVHEVRTKDDTLLTVKLMIFFELSNLEKMLDNTHDPIADFINAASSDVVAFCAALTYEQFLEKTDVLNQKSTFGQLCTRAELIGYQINKIVFRGFHSSDALQAMHDKSIQERTRLRLETDTEFQRQRHLDFQLEKEEERSGRQRQLELANAEHHTELQRKIHQQKMMEDNERQEAEINWQTKRAEAENKRLEKLRTLDVDLTKLLVAEQKAPDKHFRIDGVNGDAVKLHLHQGDQDQTAETT